VVAFSDQAWRMMLQRQVSDEQQAMFKDVMLPLYGDMHRSCCNPMGL
jgi:hypothetical protein